MKAWWLLMCVNVVTAFSRRCGYCRDPDFSRVNEDYDGLYYRPDTLPLTSLPCSKDGPRYTVNCSTSCIEITFIPIHSGIIEGKTLYLRDCAKGLLYRKPNGGDFRNFNGSASFHGRGFSNSRWNFHFCDNELCYANPTDKDVSEWHTAPAPVASGVIKFDRTRLILCGIAIILPSVILIVAIYSCIRNRRRPKNDRHIIPRVLIRENTAETTLSIHNDVVIDRAKLDQLRRKYEESL